MSYSDKYRWLHRMRDHGVIKGTRYTLGILLVKGMLVERYKDAQRCQKEASAAARVPGDLVKDLGLTHEQWFAVHDWRTAHGREAFNRGRMMEDLHVWRCDVPEAGLAEEVAL